jgi:hypothetical protein
MSYSNMKKGALVYDEDQDRMDIRFSLDDYYGGLHCGETMEVFLGGKWIPTRIEKGCAWDLVGVKRTPLPGLLVRK